MTARRSRTRQIGILAALLAVVTALAPAPASAHELRPALLVVAERSPGEFALIWVAPSQATGAVRLAPVFPPHCEAVSGRLHCGPPGLVGEIGFPDLSATDVEVVVQIRWLDGRAHTAVLAGGDDHVEVTPGFARGRAPPFPLLAAYARIGIEHVLTGFDHLAFILGLLLLVGFERRLFWTVTGFTAAHSLTLAASALELLKAPAAPVETCIALSIALVARESVRTRTSLARRRPFVVAFTFGLLHGLGFAGALSEIGLPADGRGQALFGFNAGVEVGQLAALAAVWLALRIVRPGELARARWGRATAVGLGGASVFWLLQRVPGLLG
jgi:hypothetical protein